MSKIRDFSIAIPYLCSASEPNRASTINKLIFDTELVDTCSAFQRTDKDKKDPYNRMKPFFRFDGGNKKIIKHCKHLLRIAELSHYKSEHGLSTKEEIELNKLVKIANKAEINPVLSNTSALFSVDQAKSTSTWNG